MTDLVFWVAIKIGSFLGWGLRLGYDILLGMQLPFDVVIDKNILKKMFFGIPGYPTPSHNHHFKP